MRLSAPIIASATLALLLWSATGAFSQTARGAARGEVTDGSEGVLPGVAVTASDSEGRLLGATVTDAAGQWRVAGLPAGKVTLAFALEGFATGIVGLDVHPEGESWVVERLRLAPRTEEVVVYASAPTDPPPLPRIPYVAPLAPVIVSLPLYELESICGLARNDVARSRPLLPGFVRALGRGRRGEGTGESAAGARQTAEGRRQSAEGRDAAEAEWFATIQSHRYANGRTLYASGDEVVLDGGTDHGLAVGQNLVARRLFQVDAGTDPAAMGEHTSGLVQIVSARERSSTAMVVHTCSVLMKGDWLAAYTPAYARTPDRPGVPEFEFPARILFADVGQMMGVPERLLVIDQGAEHGLEAGRRMTLFRRDDEALTRSVVGEAVVVAVRSDSATIRVVHATDAIRFGDWAALQR